MAMKKRAVPQKKKNVNDDAIIYKVMIALGMLCILLLGLQLVSRYYRLAGPMFAVQTGLGWAAIIGGILTVVFLVGWLTMRRRVAFWRYAGLPLFLLFAIVALSSWLLYSTWVTYVALLYFLYIAAAVLYMVALLYQHDFFLLSLFNACAGCVFYGLSRLYGDRGVFSAKALLLNIGLAVLTAVVAALVFAARKTDDGRLKLFGRKVLIATPELSPVLLYISCLLWLVCLVAAAILGSVFAYYSIFAVVALELIAAVYYTVKLS